jgi:hypothetical protein
MPKENKSTTFNDSNSKQDRVSITYEEIGFFPRSFSRVLDRFLKQIFSDVENLVIQEYRFYRYLFLTTLKCVLILFFVPFIVNFFAKNYLVHPLTEYFWNTQQNEIFLNSYQQKRAFVELKEFEEKLYFESLIISPFKNSSASFLGVGSSGLSPEESNNSKQNFSSLQIRTNKKTEFQNNVGFIPLLSASNSNVPDFYSEEATFSPKSFLEILPQPSSCSVPAEQAFFVPRPEGEESLSILRNDLKDEIKGQKQQKGNGNIEEFSIKNCNNILNDERKFVDLKKIQNQKENSKKELFEQRLQEKTIELAIHYNNLSIEAITNFL